MIRLTIKTKEGKKLQLKVNNIKEAMKKVNSFLKNKSLREVKVK